MDVKFDCRVRPVRTARKLTQRDDTIAEFAMNDDSLCEYIVGVSLQIQDDIDTRYRVLLIGEGVRATSEEFEASNYGAHVFELLIIAPSMERFVLRLDTFPF